MWPRNPLNIPYNNISYEVVVEQESVLGQSVTATPWQVLVPEI